uniref:Uncharacterized protein n=1 Tax=Daphnia galeata TaxID=27404 RepID=A0A8J2S5P7_9CRUS|nr:unnamed protein product [Daphnia galeata]
MYFKVAAALAIDQSTKDIARLTSCRTDLQHEDWKYLHRARLDLLPLRGYTWSSFDNKSCRHCGESSENGFHVLNNCKVNLTLATQRHDAVLELLFKLLTRKGYAATINRELPESRLRPDVELQVSGSRLMIDVAISYDHSENLEAAYTRKVLKYEHLGQVQPLVVWLPGHRPPQLVSIQEEIKTGGDKRIDGDGLALCIQLLYLTTVCHQQFVSLSLSLMAIYDTQAWHNQSTLPSSYHLVLRAGAESTLKDLVLDNLPITENIERQTS